MRVQAVTSGWSPEHPILRFVPNGVAIEVSDTGIGIAPEKQRLIFEVFQQADAGTSRKYGGTGLGPAISRELATLLGGEIKLTSCAGDIQKVLLDSRPGTAVAISGGQCKAVHFRTARTGQHRYPSSMSIADRTEIKRLLLQIERDLVAQAQLRALLATADRTIADRRENLRDVKARMRRTGRG